MLNPKCAIYYFIARKAMSSLAGMCAAVRGGTNRRGEEGVLLFLILEIWARAFSTFRRFSLHLAPRKSGLYPPPIW
jgi:hypothetical protein